MRVFVTGATGLLGRTLVPDLIRRGHQIIGLARNDANQAMVRAMHAVPYTGQGRDVDRLADGLKDVDAIVHLATGMPTTDSATEDEWTHSAAVTVRLLRNLLEASQRTGVRAVIFGSFFGVYGDHGDKWVTEDTPLAPEGISRAFAEAERLLTDAASAGKVKGTVLRLGMLYAPDALHTRGLLYALQRGQASTAGGDKLYWPQIYVGDAAQSVRLALEQSPANEIFNICDDEPVQQARLYRDLANWIGGPPPPRKAQTGGLRPYMGSLDLDALYSSVRMKNNKVKAYLGFSPQYPTYREGYRHVIEQWQAEHAVK